MSIRIKFKDGTSKYYDNVVMIFTSVATNETKISDVTASVTFKTNEIVSVVFL